MIRSLLLSRARRSLSCVVPQIDVLEAHVAELEGMVEQLDSYSKRLETKYAEFAGP